MRFSIWSSMDDWAGALEVVQHAEATGWDRAYVYDHFMDDGETADDDPLTPTLEATAMLAALASTTSRIGLACLVFGITYRHPAVLANWTATVDRISGGRLVLGLGAGWQLNEHAQYGIELGPVETRLARFDEALTVTRRLLDQRETTFAGDFYRLDRAICEPKPVQAHVPFLIGAKRFKIMDVVARHADEWNMWGLPGLIAHRRGVLDRACERIGRDPAEITTSCQAEWCITANDAETATVLARPDDGFRIVGTLDQMIDHVAAWQAVGVDEIIVPDHEFGTGARRLETMDAIIERVAPVFRS